MRPGRAQTAPARTPRARGQRGEREKEGVSSPHVAGEQAARLDVVRRGGGRGRFGDVGDAGRRGGGRGRVDDGEASGVVPATGSGEARRRACGEGRRCLGSLVGEEVRTGGVGVAAGQHRGVEPEPDWIGGEACQRSREVGRSRAGLSPGGAGGEGGDRGEWGEVGNGLGFGGGG